MGKEGREEKKRKQPCSHIETQGHLFSHSLLYDFHPGSKVVLVGCAKVKKISSRREK